MARANLHYLPANHSWSTDIENGIDHEQVERGVSYNCDITLRPGEFRFREYGHARKPSE
jgi:hypothetical protein